jgi:hypothetical protein
MVSSLRLTGSRTYACDSARQLHEIVCQVQRPARVPGDALEHLIRLVRLEPRAFDLDQRENRGLGRAHVVRQQLQGILALTLRRMQR